LPRAYFIYGSPGETRQTIRETVDLIKQIKPLSAIFYILDIFPGTALYADFKKRTNVTDDIWLDRLEDIMYFQTDPDLTSEEILSFGEKLRSCFYENLPDFVEEIRLIQDASFKELHADFLSRTAMTFSHGDYAAIDAVKNKDAVAERLYLKSLDYFKNHRAYLGLAMTYQRKREFGKSIKVITEGLGCFPESDQMNICQGINYMNLGYFKEALAHFSKFESSRDAVFYIAECYRAIGDDHNAAIYRKKYERRP
jgi:tetratricopeptide (TPR) repeat protein